MRATVWLTVGPLWWSRSAIRARSGDDALLLELEDRPQVHLRGVDQIVHCVPSPVTRSVIVRRTSRLANADTPNQAIFGGSRRRRAVWEAGVSATRRSVGAAQRSLRACSEGRHVDTLGGVGRGAARYDLGDHPLDPVRVELTMALARELGVLDRGVRSAGARRRPTDAVLTPRARPRLPRRGPRPRRTGRRSRHRPRHRRQPGLPAACTRPARSSPAPPCAAAEAVWRGAAQRAVNIAGGLHHAMPARASGFCVYNDPAVAIARLLDARRPAGRLRRHRRPPRRRRAGTSSTTTRGCSRSACTRRR